MSVSAALRSRISANNFDASATISEETVAELVALAAEAPSSFNIQHTRFVAVTDPELKGKLRAVAYGQAKVSEAAVSFVILGDTLAHEDYVVRTRAAAAAGYLPVELAERLCGMAAGMYSNPAMAREEAVRSAGLSGMALMLAAEEKGLGSCPLIGFDPAGVAGVLGLSARYVPAMIITVGPLADGNMGRKHRLPVADLLRVNSGF